MMKKCFIVLAFMQLFGLLKASDLMNLRWYCFQDEISKKFHLDRETILTRDSMFALIGVLSVHM